jgi:hypothetical protein
MLTLLAFPAWAQSANPSGPAQVTTPSGQNSGAGISGQPGNKSGPAAKPGSATTGSAGSQAGQNATTRQQDPAKIPGLPGGKSGRATSPPSGAK